nr:hypothetical protein CFP56_01792 [Quercus suber]
MTTLAMMSSTEKETEDMVADIGEFPKSNTVESTIPKESIRPNFQDHGNQGISFTQQLKDIVNDLGIYKDPVIIGQLEEFQTDQENSPLFDLGTLRKDLDENISMSRAPTLVPPLEKNSATPLSDITNS